MSSSTAPPAPVAGPILNPPSDTAPAASPKIEYTLCQTYPSLLAAAEVLKESLYLIIDCEGQEIGRASGNLSIVSIATARAERIFLIDVPALLALRSGSFNPFQPLSHILTSGDIHKVVWDGRADWLALRDTCQIVLAGVLDLQLADLPYARLYEKPLSTQHRLARAFGVSMSKIKKNPGVYGGFEAVRGLQQSLQGHGLAKGTDGGKDRKSFHFRYGEALEILIGLPSFRRCHAQKRPKFSLDGAPHPEGALGLRRKGRPPYDLSI